MNPARHTRKFKSRLRMHIKEYLGLCKIFGIISREVAAEGWIIAIEWPAPCRYWRRKEVAKLKKDLDLRTAHCRGCAMGLVDDANLPIAKPWHISTNGPVLWQTMNAQRCPGKPVHNRHSGCQGKYAKRPETYTPALAR